MARRVLVVVSYARDRSHYPRGGSPRRRRAIYWSNIAVQAATLHHVAPEVEFVVCSTDTPPAGAGRVLASAGASVRHVPFDHQPPDGFYARYAGSLYMFDTMAALVPEVGDDDVVMFVDPDIVWVRPPRPAVDEIDRGGVVAYELQVPEWLPMCDVPRAQQAQIIAEISGHAVPHPPTHFGGEFYGMLGRELAPLVDDVAPWWDATLQRHRDGQPHFKVEEHVMNAVLWTRGEQEGRAHTLLSRIRTLPKPIGTRERAHPDLVAWHLPFEKDRAFPRLHRELVLGRRLPPPGPAYERWLRRRMGIDARGLRWVADRARVAKWAVQRLHDPATDFGL